MSTLNPVSAAGVRPVVVQTEQLDEQAAAWLAERCELIVAPFQAGEPPAPALAKADGVVIRTYTRVDDAFLRTCSKLKVVARAGVGLDNVDIAACKARGVVVLSTPGANTRAVVELVTAFMLDALRPRVFLDRALSPAEWAFARKDLLAKRQLSTLTLGIVGFGRVGRSIARIGAALDMRIIYNDLIDIPAEHRAGAEPVSLERVLSGSDIVSLHVDGRSSNRGLIGERQLQLLKPDAVLINTSRGMVLNAQALAHWLTANPAAQALLDVHEPEPIGPDYPLLGLPNAHLSPHIGAATTTAHANMSWVVKDLWRVLTGEKPEHPAW